MAGNTGIAGLLVSLNSGSLVPGFTYLLAYELFTGSPEKDRQKISLYAGLIAAFTPILFKSSIVIMSDSLGLMFAVWSLWLAVKYYNKAKPYHLILSSVLLAFAVMTRYVYAILTLIFLILVLIRLIKNKAGLSKFVRDAVTAFAAGLIAFSLQLYYILNFGIPYMQHGDNSGMWTLHWDMMNFLRSSFTTLDGTFDYRFVNGIFYSSPVFHPMYLSLFGIAFLSGLYFLIRHKNKPTLLICLSWILFFYLYLSGNPFQSLRFTMSYLPAMVIVSAAGIGYFKMRATYKNLLLSAGLIVLLLYNVYHMSGFMEQKQKELDVVNWIGNNIPESSAVIAFDITLAVSHYTKIKADELFNLKKNELINKIDIASNDIYLVLPVEKIKSQWKGQPLEQNCTLLETKYKLTTIAHINDFTIFKLTK